MIKEQYAINLRLSLNKIRKVHAIAIFLSMFLQLLLSYDAVSYFPLIVLIASSSFFSIRVLTDSKRVQIAPIPALMIIYFDLATLSMPMIVKSISFQTVYSSLNVPWETFIILIFAELSMLLAYVIYCNSMLYSRLVDKLSSFYQNSISLFEWPSNKALYLAGAIGLLSKLLTGEYAEGGIDSSVPAYMRFLEAFSFLAYAPFLAAFRSTLGDSDNHSDYSKSTVALFFVLLVAAGVLRNYRGIFVDAAMLYTSLSLLMYFTGKKLLPTPKLSTLLIIGVVALVVLPIFSRLALAMLVAREYRLTHGMFELMGITFQAFFDSSQLEYYKAIREDIASSATGYTEDYVDSRLLSRFIMTKFHDNMVFYLNYMGDGSSAYELFSYLVQRVVGLLPSPILHAIGYDLDKNIINSTFGDYLIYLAEGWGLSGHKTGTMIMELWALCGIWYVPMLILISLALFVFYSALNMITRKDLVIYSPIGLLLMWRLVGTLGSYGFNSESVLNLVSGLTRATIQTVLIYVVVFKIIGLIFRKRKN